VGTESTDQPFVEHLEHRGCDCGATVSSSLNIPLVERTGEKARRMTLELRRDGRANRVEDGGGATRVEDEEEEEERKQDQRNKTET
jgi:hypothetical protein